MSESLNSDGETKLASVATLLQQLREQRDNEPAPSVTPVNDFDAPLFKADLDSDAARKTQYQQVRRHLWERRFSLEER